MSEMAARSGWIVLGKRPPFQTVALAHHGHIAEHLVDTLYPFLGLEDMGTNLLGDLLDQKILEQLSLLRIKQGFLYLDLFTEPLKQLNGTAHIVAQECNAALDVYVGTILYEDMVFFVVDLQEIVVGVVALLLQHLFACQQLMLVQRLPQEPVSRTCIVSLPSNLSNLCQLYDRVGYQQVHKVCS